ncbi:hypothetical protein F0562_001790 [Nyssa sinensis]|uniref:Reverse transcriptase/retrotransposon-derived protein RNase H-like domain-containing protein n=1 Tax=Nyssa sinensis TaxID=561372 RepID=A0A5J5C573_9ASTE|nr:hypothetical protein F0562_001790 [Nyssa sinensis]
MKNVGDRISPPRAHLTTERDKTRDDDNQYDANSLLLTEARPQPFKVEARINILAFDGTIDTEKLDSWVDQLETYFMLYGFSSGKKVAFARLKLTSHALAWWNAFLKTNDDREANQVFAWTKQHEYTFLLLKRKINEASVLALPDLQKPFEIEGDASGYTMRVVLMQEGRSIEYHLEMFPGATKNYPT